MVVAWVTNHVMNGFFIFRPGEGWEYVGSVALVTTALGTLGGREWSLDNSLDITFSGFDGFWLTMVGVAGALALLAVFWRPERVRNAPGVVAVFATFGLLGAVALGLG